MLKKILQSPITLIIAMILGVPTGLFLKPIVPIIEPINSIYISLLQVCSLPIIICAITVNIGKIFQKSFRTLLKKWIISSVILMIISSVIGVLVSASFADFLKPSEQTKISLSQADNKSVTESFSEIKAYDDNNISNENEFSFVDFLVSTVPNNIFHSLSENLILQVVIFFMIFGIMIKFIEKRNSDIIINLLDGVSNALYKFIGFLISFLPVSGFIMMASLFSKKNIVSIISSVFRYIIVNYIVCIVIIIVSFIVIAIYKKCPLKKQITAMKRTFLISVSTSSRSATLPIVIEDSINKMSLDKTAVNSILPINTILCSSGKIATSATLAVYALVVYDVPINMSTLSIVIFSAVLFSISITGVSGIASITMLSVLLQPVGIPTDVISIVLMSSIQFYQGFSTFAGIYSTISIISFVES